jgi:hypothetical protein
MQIRRNRMPGIALRGLAVLLTLASVGTARADEAYFLLVFGSQRTPPNPDYSHSFATFVKVTGEGPCLENPCLEAHTISWLPANLMVRTCALLPECGHNFDLHPTLRYVFDSQERVSVWGPYRIEPELYCRALKQIRLLESGQVRYKAIDAGHHSDEVSNCIHAISSLAGGYRLRILSPSFGETASYYITERLSPWILDEGKTYDWIVYKLGLDAYPLIYRDWQQPPRSGAIRAPINRVLGHERDVCPSYGPRR